MWRQLLPRLDTRSSGEAAYQLPQVALPQPPAGGTGQQRAGQCRRTAQPGSAGTVGQVGVKRGHGRRGQRDLGLPGALAGHPQHPVSGIGAEVGHVRGAGLVHPQRVV